MVHLFHTICVFISHYCCCRCIYTKMAIHLNENTHIIEIQVKWSCHHDIWRYLLLRWMETECTNHCANSCMECLNVVSYHSKFLSLYAALLCVAWNINSYSGPIAVCGLLKIDEDVVKHLLSLSHIFILKPSFSNGAGICSRMRRPECGETFHCTARSDSRW